MRLSRIVARIAPALVLAAVLAAPAGATTLIRQGLESLIAENETIVRGQVLDIHSYWNKDHSFILTDVRLRPSESLKGNKSGKDITVTVLGGTVGEITTLVIGTPELVPGSEYLLFANREDLPGVEQTMTVRDLIQGVFEISDSPKGRRAFSQALGHPLLPDLQGRSQPPGGAEGLDLEETLAQIRRIVNER